MTSPSPSQITYGQPTGSSLIPFFAGPGPQVRTSENQNAQQQRADMAEYERLTLGSNRISTPTLPSPGGSRGGQMPVGGARPIGSQNSSQQNNAQRFSEQSPMLWRNGSASSFIGGPTGPRGNAFTSNPSLDLSEFPSLTNRDSNTNINPLSGRTPYVMRLNHHFAFGMVKNPNSEASEFHIQNEDFPALPGSNLSNSQQTPTDQISQQQHQVQNGLTNGLTSLHSSEKSTTVNGDRQLKEISGSTPTSQENSGTTPQRKQIITSKDGRVSNIPSDMIRDQYGMVGLLTFIRVAESEPNLVSLALGSDLTSLGLNLNSQENLYTVFGGPWAEQALRPHEIEFSVPQEYLINTHIKEKLCPVKLTRYSEDTLFFMFYMFGGDIMQLLAAAELYSRDWRFHRDERVWITRAGINPTEKTNTYERGTYYFFDPINWRKVAKEFHLAYERLEERPPTISFPTGL